MSNPAANTKETAIQSVQRHEEYAREKGLNEIFSLLVTDALLHPEESEDLEERFKKIIKEQIAERQGRQKEEISVIKEKLEAATAECKEKPWRPRSRSDQYRLGLRPATVPSRMTKSASAKNAAPAKSEAVVQLEAERDQWRRKYYEQMAKVEYLKKQEAQLMKQIAEAGGQEVSAEPTSE